MAPKARKTPPKGTPPPPVSTPEKKALNNQHVPTEPLRNLVSLAMLNDMTHEQAAKLVGIDRKTLVLHYADELANGKDRMLARVSGNLYRIASQSTDIKAALTAAIFVMKCKGGWNDRAAAADASVEVTPTSNGPVKFTLRLGDRPQET